MSLTSYLFIAFVAVTLVLYYLAPGKGQWMLLLCADLVFYFWSMRLWALVLVATAFICYVTALGIDTINRRSKAWLASVKGTITREEKKKLKKGWDRRKRWIVLAGILCSFGILFVFKYTGFTVDNVNFLLGAFGKSARIKAPDLLLPMGISFYTLQAAGYLLDVYWERGEAQRSFPRFLLFVSFFPQLIQGPISRYDQLSETLYGPHPFRWEAVSFGLQRVLWGFFKKLVVADTFRVLVLSSTTDADTAVYTGFWVFFGILVYSVQLYADFTGGIDIAIGVAEIFGIRLAENFVRPFFSKSIAEFWRRWHITMGTWFRDYIFYPMSISGSMRELTLRSKKLFGKGFARRLPVWIVTMVTWLATGVWHGARWYFIVWGVLNGLIILISEELTPIYDRFHAAFPGALGSKAYTAFAVVRTFLLMGSLRLFDCYQDVTTTFSMFGKMFTEFRLSQITGENFLALGVKPEELVVPVIGVALMFFCSLWGRDRDVRRKLAERPFVLRFLVFGGLLVSVVLFGKYGVGFESAGFIYNQF